MYLLKEVTTSESWRFTMLNWIKSWRKKGDQYVDLVGWYNKKVKVKDANLEVKTKELVKTRAALQSKEQEIVKNNESIKHWRNKLSTCDK